MKKIDLHIHTVSTFSDNDFDFSLEMLRDYVSSAKIDAIAITNHDFFDIEQFKGITSELDITVLPGIEINLKSGQVLIIDGEEDLDDFYAKTTLISEKITKIGDFITVSELERIFGNLNNYLVIPHYEKNRQ